MSITRKYATKKGEERVKVYDSIGGVSVKEYRRSKSKAFRDRNNANKTLAPQADTEPQPQPPKAPRLTKAEAIPINDVRQMQEYARVGLSYAKIGALFGVSRYVVQQAVLLR